MQMQTIRIDIIIPVAIFCQYKAAEILIVSFSLAYPKGILYKKMS